MSSIFPMDRLPDFIITKTFTKMSPKAFVKFHRTNKKMYSLCHSRENLFCFPVDSLLLKGSESPENFRALLFNKDSRIIHYKDVKEALPFRIKCKELKLMGIDEDREMLVREFVKLIRKRQITCDLLCLYCQLSGQEIELAWCIEITRPSRVSIHGYLDEGDNFIPSQFFPITLFENVTRLTTDASDYTDHNLLRLNAKFIDMKKPKITAAGINHFLQQWFANEREIEYISLTELDAIAEEVVVRDVPVCLVYNTAWHPYSLIAECSPPQNGLSRLQHVYNCSFYHLIRHGNFEQMHRLEIRKNSITIQEDDNPGEYITPYPSPYQ